MLKRLLTLSIILIGVLGLNAQTISGTVQDYNGVAIANHTVEIMNTDSMNPYYTTTTTNSSGAFSFGNLPSGSYGYVVYTQNCQNQYQYVTLSSNSGVANFTICSSNPTSCAASFISTPDSANPLVVYFSDYSSGNPTSWTWNFGDGTSSTLQNPNHTYTANGTYIVTLNIASANCSDSTSQSVVVGTVTASCAAAFYYYPDSANQNIINFFDFSSGNPNSWSWNFGDGTSSNLQNPSHTYTANGTYVVTLNIASANCSDSTSQSIVVGVVSPSCAASFYYYPDSANQNMINFFDFSSGNPNSWSWNFGDGTTSSLQNPVHTYSSTGSYTVTLYISSANCSDSISQVVTLGNTSSCQAAFSSVLDSNTVNAVIFTDQSTGNINAWNWSFGDGATSSLQNPVHTYSTAGTYNVTLMVYGNQNCQSIITNAVVVGSVSSAYSISGYVLAGNNSVTNGVVSLFSTTLNSFVASTVLDSSGSYYFSNISSGSYKILAIPDSSSAISQNFAPTYYGDAILWSNASTVALSSNQSLGAINLVAAPAIPGGNGSISGNVGTGSKAASDNVIVNLLDDNLNFVSTTRTDANGDYSFANLAYNTYKIWVEIAGKVTTPISVTLDANNSTSSGNDFVESNGAVVPKANSIMNDMQESNISLYPNPVQDILNVELDIANTASYSFSIYNIAGQLISNEIINITSGNNLVKLNTNSLKSGSYILIISSDNTNSIQKMFVK